MRDLHNNIDGAETICQVCQTGTITGDAVDIKGYGSAELIVCSGTLVDGSFVCELQESDVVGSGFAAVADASLIGTEPTFAVTDDKIVKRVGYIGIKRFLKCVITASGATTGGPICAMIVRGHPDNAPLA